jgi:hypothetical protein
MRRWMHTCYSLITNEGFQTLILKSQPSLELLHFLALERYFSAEQMSKRPQQEVEGMYLYTPQLNPTVTCQLSKIRTDRTRRSMWPNASIDDNSRNCYRHRWVTGRTDQGWPDAFGCARTLLYFDRTLDRVRSMMTARVRLAKYLTGTRPDALWTRPIVFQSRPISLLTLYDTCQHDQRVQSSQGPRPVNQVETQWLSALTGRVRSRVNGSNDFKTRRNLNRVASNWTLGFTWAT